MGGTIAWTRLIVFSSASILLLTEVYRLILILLTLIIIAPLLMVWLQNFIQWGLVIGFAGITIGLYKLLTISPPLLKPEEFLLKDIKKSYLLSMINTIILGMLVLLPPISIVSPSSQLVFSIIMSFLWFTFYLLITIWILQYWNLVDHSKKISDKFRDGKKVVHFALSIMITFFWLVETFTLIFLQITLFSIDTINIFYIIVMVLFLLNQINLFFKLTRFSYLIYG